MEITNIDVTFYHGEYGRDLALAKAVNGAIVFDTVTRSLYVNQTAFDLNPKFVDLESDLVAKIAQEKDERVSGDENVLSQARLLISMLVDGADDYFGTLRKIQTVVDGVHTYTEIEETVSVVTELPDPTALGSPNFVRMDETYYRKNLVEGVYTYVSIPSKTDLQNNPSSYDPPYVVSSGKIMELKSASSEIKSIRERVEKNETDIAQLKTDVSKPVIRDVKGDDYISSTVTESIAQLTANIGVFGTRDTSAPLLEGLATVGDVKRYMEERLTWDEYVNA